VDQQTMQNQIIATILAKKNKDLTSYICNNDNLQKLNITLMSRIMDLEKRAARLEKRATHCCDAIVAMEAYLIEKERFERYLKGGFSHECPF
jgi:hypothetical protein